MMVRILFQVSTKIVFVASELYGVTMVFGMNNSLTINSHIYSLLNIKYISVAIKYLHFPALLNDSRVLQDLLHDYCVDLQLLSLVLFSIRVNFLWNGDTNGRNGTFQENC
jgi:hypothetical protein